MYLPARKGLRAPDGHAGSSRRSPCDADDRSGYGSADTSPAGSRERSSAGRGRGAPRSARPAHEPSAPPPRSAPRTSVRGEARTPQRTRTGRRSAPGSRARSPPSPSGTARGSPGRSARLPPRDCKQLGRLVCTHRCAATSHAIASRPASTSPIASAPHSGAPSSALPIAHTRQITNHRIGPCADAVPGITTGAPRSRGRESVTPGRAPRREPAANLERPRNRAGGRPGSPGPTPRRT